MPNTGFMWECSCGHIEYNDEEPEECEKCGKIGKFIKMPEEIVEERMKEEAVEDYSAAPKKSISEKKAKPKSGRKKK